MNRQVSLFLLFIIILSLSHLNSALAQNWAFKDAVVSNGGIYALAENHTLLRLTGHRNPIWRTGIPDKLHVRLASAPEGVLLVGDVLAKLDKNGNLLWAKNMSVDDAVALPDGSVIFVSGNTLGILNSDGTTLWARQLILNGTNESLPGVGIHINAVTPLNGAFLVTGTADLPEDPKSHLFIGVVLLNGTLLWAKVLNTGYHDYPDTAVSFEDNGVVAGVYGGGSDAPWIADYFVLKVSSDGKISWFNSYLCPGKKDWDAFWSMKILSTFCNGEICVLGTTTGTFILDDGGNSLLYLNVSGKIIGIVNDSTLILSNGTLLTIPLKWNEGTEKCYTLRISFREVPVNITALSTKFNAPNASLHISPSKEPTKLDNEDVTPRTHTKEYWTSWEYLDVALVIIILTGIILVMVKKRG